LEEGDILNSVKEIFMEPPENANNKITDLMKF
jgi:hypothetical protein